MNLYRLDTYNICTHIYIFECECVYVCVCVTKIDRILTINILSIETFRKSNFSLERYVKGMHLIFSGLKNALFRGLLFSSY